MQLAIVVDNKDGDGNPGYRVKLKLPWLNEQESTFWARIAVPMGGSGRGTYVLPEIDDQVLVVFEHGDINRPIVVGALWSKKQEPVEANQSGKNNTKLIKSRSGHRIIFDDKEGAEKITIVDSTKKNKIVLDSASKIVKIESDGDIEVTAKTNVILHSNALKIGTREGVTGKARSVLVHAAKTFGVKATSGITISGGNTTINTSNAAACSVSGSGAGELGAAAAEKAKDPVEDKNGGGGGTDGGGAPGGGRGSRGSVSSSLPSSSRTASPADTAPLEDSTHFVHFEIKDNFDRPIASAEAVLVHPSGAREPVVLQGGRLRREAMASGSYELRIKRLGRATWSVERVVLARDRLVEVELTVATDDIEDGIPIQFLVFAEFSERGRPIARLDATVSSGIATTCWRPDPPHEAVGRTWRLVFYAVEGRKFVRSSNALTLGFKESS